MMEFYCYRKGKEIDDNDIKKVEEYIKEELPNKYKEFVKNYNGCKTTRNRYYLEGSIEVIDRFLSLSTEDSENVIEAYKYMMEEHEEKLIPIILDPFGNYVGIKYDDNKNPLIVFWDKEEENYKIINDSFEKFINSLFENKI